MTSKSETRSKMGHRGSARTSTTELYRSFGASRRIRSIEPHLHDTTIEDESITLELADGRIVFAVDPVTGYCHHHHSLGDYGRD